MTDRTPLYEAAHAGRYERQRLIREYQDSDLGAVMVQQSRDAMDRSSRWRAVWRLWTKYL